MSRGLGDVYKRQVYEHILVIYTYIKHTHKYKVYEHILVIYTYIKHTHKYKVNANRLSNLKMVRNYQTGL